MSGKSTLQIDVTAETSKATQKVQTLQKQLQASTSKGGPLFDTSNITSATSEFGKLQQQLSSGDFGGLGSSLNQMAGSLTKLPSLAKVGAASLGGIGIAATAVGVQLKKMVDRGVESYKSLEKFNVTFQNIDRNIGGVGRDFGDFSNKLQLMSANGSNSFEELGSAAQTLLVAFKGDRDKTMDLIRTFDDLSAGTGIAVSDLAGMAAEAQNTGVSIKDLQRLSNKGIPIYQALAQAMGVSADEAESMAKRHMVTTENLFEAYSKLKDIYKGLSQELSGSTLEGAEATYEASKKLRDQSFGQGYSEERKRYLNAESEKLQADAASPQMQAFAAEVGKATAAVENLGTALASVPEKWVTIFAAARDWFSGGEVTEEYTKNRARQDKVEFDKGFKNRETLSAGQIKELINMISGDKWGAFSEEDGRVKDEYVLKRNELRELFAQKQESEQREAAWQQEQAQKDQKAQMTLKYSDDVGEKIKAISGRNGLPQFESVEQIPAIIENIKKGLIEGTSVDTVQDEANLKILNELRREGESQTQAAIKAEEELAKKRKEAADSALQAKMDENEKYIQGKAQIGREITDAQKNYDSVTSKVNEMQAARQQIADEEAHGIFRKKWGNLSMSEVSTKEAQLLKEQQEAGKKLAELKQSYETYDQRWKQARTQIQNFFTSVVAGNVVPIKGVPITG